MQAADRKCSVNVPESSKGSRVQGELTVDALVSQVDHLAEKLKAYDPENKQKGFFNNSSIDKLRQAVETLPSINSDIFL